MPRISYFYTRTEIQERGGDEANPSPLAIDDQGSPLQFTALSSRFGEYSPAKSGAPNGAVYTNLATTAFPLDSLGSTLQRIEIRARQLLQFAEVACVKTKSRAKHLFFQV
jgi:hypothetical protein